jgi:hypothetical protein
MEVANNTAPSGDGPLAPITPAVDPGTPQPEKFNSVSEAARFLSKHRVTKNQTQAEPSSEPVAAAPVEATPELPSQEGNDSPAEPVPVETQADDPAELPPIEPPRSWTKEHKEAFGALPRDIQERVSEVERTREADFLRRQNEAAEKLKGLTAKEQQAEQLRQQYEAALPQVFQLVQQQGAEFADVQTQADVDRMLQEDLPRYIRWQAHNDKLGRVATELQAVEQQRAKETNDRWKAYADEQDKKVSELIPDLADPAKAPKVREQAMKVLHDHGFTDEELTASWGGQRGISLRDARIQKIIHAAMKWTEAQAKAKEAVAKPVPPVQRPGVAQNRGSAADAEIQALTKKLETSTGINALRAAAQLTAAKRAASAR